MEAGLSEDSAQNLADSSVTETQKAQRLPPPPKITPVQLEMLVDKEMLVHRLMLLPNSADVADAADLAADVAQAAVVDAAVAPEDVAERTADAAAAKWFI